MRAVAHPVDVVGWIAIAYRCGEVIAKPDPGAKVVTVGGMALSWSIVAHAGHCA
ncbi:hypothetical protein [Frankia sp. Cr2]|uniref:hypothetical protein n=1 Tax=Frankia sp. Cr2 TaxID=3073932 RepID=UPI002AD2FCFE|nr:hypothetical protein [Frankia sp. Cr2]